MKRLIVASFAIILLSGCVVTDTTGKVLNKTSSVIGNIMEGGKIHLTFGIETDAVYNDTKEE